MGLSRFSLARKELCRDTVQKIHSNAFFFSVGDHNAGRESTVRLPDLITIVALLEQSVLQKNDNP